MPHSCALFRAGFYGTRCMYRRKFARAICRRRDSIALAPAEMPSIARAQPPTVLQFGLKSGPGRPAALPCEEATFAVHRSAGAFPGRKVAWLGQRSFCSRLSPSSRIALAASFCFNSPACPGQWHRARDLPEAGERQLCRGHGVCVLDAA